MSKLIQRETLMTATKIAVGLGAAVAAPALGWVDGNAALLAWLIGGGLLMVWMTDRPAA
jgi:hypothetical protein